MGVATGTYEGWEKGWRQPRREQYDLIARFFGEPMPVILHWMGLLTAEQAEKLNGATRPYIKSPLRDYALATAS